MPNTLENAVLKKEILAGGVVKLTVEFIGIPGLTDCTFAIRDSQNNLVQQLNKHLKELLDVAGGKKRYSFDLTAVEKQHLRNNKFFVTSLSLSPAATFNPNDWAEVDLLQAFPKGWIRAWWEKIKSIFPQRTNTISNGTFNWKWALGIAIAFILLMGMIGVTLVGFQLWKHRDNILAKITGSATTTPRTNPPPAMDIKQPPPALDLPTTPRREREPARENRSLEGLRTPRSPSSNPTFENMFANNNSGEIQSVKVENHYHSGGLASSEMAVVMRKSTLWAEQAPDKVIDLLPEAFQAPKGTKLAPIEKIVPTGKLYAFRTPYRWKVTPKASIGHPDQIKGAYLVGSRWIDWRQELDDPQESHEHRFQAFDKDITLVFELEAY